MSLSLDTHIQRLPKDFLFGVATSSYQIEGSDFGNCGLSHWDEFAKKSGRVFNSDDGSKACNHYHLWETDLDLIHGAGFQAYRFSFSWPRLLPEASKTINPDGIAFYDKLIDGGIIVCDDYNSLEFDGAKKAWDNFFLDQKVSFKFVPSLGSSFIVK